jgi:hypothetical protein
MIPVILSGQKTAPQAALRGQDGIAHRKTGMQKWASEARYSWSRACSPPRT